MMDRLALRVFRSSPETKHWNIRPEDFARLDSTIELKRHAYRVAENLIEELTNATRAMYDSGDAVTKDPAMTANVWAAMLREVQHGN